MEKLFTPWRFAYIKGHIQTGPKIHGCPFCELPALNEDEKALILYRSKHSFVIMNRYPYTNGHLMVLPYEHEGDLTKLGDEILIDIHKVLIKTEKILFDFYKCHGMNIGRNAGKAAGAGIPGHAHYHLVPRWEGDTNFISTIGDLRLIPEDLTDTYQKLRPLFDKN